MSERKGKLIVLEGVDKSGKTTLMENLSRDSCDYIGHPFVSMPILGACDTGKEIKRILMQWDNLSGEVRTLLNMANIKHTVDVFVNPLLEQGINVILDRYVLATAVYQTLEGVDESTILSIAKMMNLPIPDLVVLLDSPEPLGGEREKDSTDHYDSQGVEERNKRIAVYREVHSFSEEDLLGGRERMSVNPRDIGSMDDLAAYVGSAINTVLSGEKLNNK